jgi:hypothetical protein
VHAQAGAGARQVFSWDRLGSGGRIEQISIAELHRRLAEADAR